MSKTPDRHPGEAAELEREIAGTYYLEVTRSGGQVSTVVYWTNSGKTQKIREVIIARSGGQVSTVTTKQYNSAGILTETETETVTRASGQVASIDSVAS